MKPELEPGSPLNGLPLKLLIIANFQLSLMFGPLVFF